MERTISGSYREPDIVSFYDDNSTYLGIINDIYDAMMKWMKGNGINVTSHMPTDLAIGSAVRNTTRITGREGSKDKNSSTERECQKFVFMRLSKKLKKVLHKNKNYDIINKSSSEKTRKSR